MAASCHAPARSASQTYRRAARPQDRQAVPAGPLDKHLDGECGEKTGRIKTAGVALRVARRYSRRMRNPMNTIEEQVITRSPAETRALAARLLPGLPPNSVLALHGELGSGKTCFVQGLARAMGIPQAVWSPTFTLINEYHVRPMPLYHADLYRVRDAHEAELLGLEEYFDRGGLTVIEWAERAAELLPPRTFHLHFRLGNTESERIIMLQRAPL